MRIDISLDPKATHYCKYCGYTMKARDLLSCPVRDGDFCEPKKRKKLRTNAARGGAK